MAKKRKKAENPGEFLQQRRWRDGVSIENSAYALRVETAQLEAIEAWDLGKLPKGIYLDSLMYKYARLLGVTQQELAAAFPDYVQVADDELTSIHNTIKLAGRTVIVSRVLVLALIGCIVLIVASYVVWQSSGLNSKPRLDLSNIPERTNQESFELNGRASEGAQVFVNGTAILVEPDGSFITTVVLREGPNHLEVRAVNNLSQETITDETIIYNKIVLQ